MKIGSGPLRCFPAAKLLKRVGCFGLSVGAIQLGRREHSFTHRLSVALLQNRERDLTSPRDVKKTTERSNNWNIMNSGDIPFRNRVVVKPKDWGQWNAPTESPRNIMSSFDGLRSVRSKRDRAV